VKDTTSETAALTPLWSLTLGTTLGAGSSMVVSPIGPSWIPVAAAVLGIALILVAAVRGRLRSAPIWFLAGLMLAGGHGLHQAADRHRIETLIDKENPVWVRARMAVTEGWSRGKWGWRARVRVLEAHHKTAGIPPLKRCRLEIRGSLDPRDLPRPGTEIEALVSIRGSPQSPLLVASSSRLLNTTNTRRWLPAARDHLARRLLEAAGLDVRRLRAAELAAALSLGRRDLLPPARREGWRRSGLAHVLAVSGLHVGLVAGMVWLFLAGAGASPTTGRWIILLTLPTYALMAGGAPSAVRAALMGSVFVGARLLGRAIVPMSAVLVTASTLLVADPSLIRTVSFQLTILLTAALLRWAPALVTWLPLPRWLSAAVAIPVIAQLAAAPLVAVHFASAVPGAAAANLLVPWLLGPVVAASVGAAAVAPLTPTLAGWLLEVVHGGERALWAVSTPGRWIELIPPPVPLILLILLGLSGLVALLPGRTAKKGVLVYIVILTASSSWWWIVPPAPRIEAELLPVSHGLALRISSPDTQILVDGGGLQREAAELLAAPRVHHLDAVIATHADEDHSGGLDTVLRTTHVEVLIVPRWMLQADEAVPLIRMARRRGVTILPFVRGSRFSRADWTMEVVWPDPNNLPHEENERSLVARVLLSGTSILITSDIGNSTERLLVRNTYLESDLLIVPHHGSRHSSSRTFLEAVDPSIALIPAGPKNLHHHPHPEVLDRLESLHIDSRMPIRDGRCGARWVDGRWVLYPEKVGRK